MTKIPLLPCPFCGGDPEIITRSGYKIIRCGNQNCLVDCHVQHGTLENMVRAWNTRSEYKSSKKIAEIDMYERQGVLMAGVKIAGCVDYKSADEWIEFSKSIIAQIITRLTSRAVDKSGTGSSPQELPSN